MSRVDLEVVAEDDTDDCRVGTCVVCDEGVYVCVWLSV